VSAAAPEVIIIDGGGANIASLKLALQRLGYTGLLSSDAAMIRAASHVILPGVGAARAAMERLQSAGLDTVIPTLRQPVLGICLGLQLLFESSEEDDVDCLGILPGCVRRFAPAPDRPIPHMGWNQIRRSRESRLLDGIPDDSYFYFVHSYAADLSEHTIATTDYGRSFTAVAGRDNFYAAQFHPERSGPLGARILENFLSHC
jgi:glutamine amidotransferase